MYLKTIKLEGFRCPVCGTETPNMHYAEPFWFFASYRCEGRIWCAGRHCDYRSSKTGFDDLTDLQENASEWWPQNTVTTRLEQLRDYLKGKRKDAEGNPDLWDAYDDAFRRVKRMLQDEDPV